MLSFVMTDINGGSVCLENPVYMTLSRDEDVPADALSATFPFMPIEEMKEIRVYDGSELIFSGVVDEQQNISGNSGAYLRVIARSMAAVLLDNESRPRSFNNPSTPVIARFFLESNGLTSYSGGNVTVRNSLKVAKGMTDWQSLCSFCARAYGTVPRVESDGSVSLKGLKRGEKIVFSPDRVGYCSVKENNKRCELISAVYVKQSPSGGYETLIPDREAMAKGVDRRRFLDSSSRVMSVSLADKMVENAKRRSYSLTLVCPDRLTEILGRAARVEDGFIGSRDSLYVSSIFYKLGPRGEFTTVTLKKETENVDT